MWKSELADATPSSSSKCLKDDPNRSFYLRENNKKTTIYFLKFEKNKPLVLAAIQVSIFVICWRLYWNPFHWLSGTDAWFFCCRSIWSVLFTSVEYAFIHTYVSCHIISCNPPHPYLPFTYCPFSLSFCPGESQRWQRATSVSQLNLSYSWCPRTASTPLLPTPLLLPSSLLPRGCTCIQLPWARGICAYNDPTTFYTLPNLGPDPSKSCGNKLFYKPVTGMV